MKSFIKQYLALFILVFALFVQGTRAYVPLETSQHVHQSKHLKVHSHVFGTTHFLFDFQRYVDEIRPKLIESLGALNKSPSLCTQLVPYNIEALFKEHQSSLLSFLLLDLPRSHAPPALFV